MTGCFSLRFPGEKGPFFSAFRSYPAKAGLNRREKIFFLLVCYISALDGPGADSL